MIVIVVFPEIASFILIVHEIAAYNFPPAATRPAWRCWRLSLTTKIKNPEQSTRFEVPESDA